MTNNMFEMREIVAIRQQRDQNFESPWIEVKAHTVGIDSSTTPAVNGREGYIWVREYGQNGGVSQVFNPNKVQNRINLPVVVRYHRKKPWLKIVHDVDWEAVILNTTFEQSSWAISNHHEQHEWPDGDPAPDVVNFYPRAFVPLRVFSNGDLTLGVAPMTYQYDGTFVDYPGDVSIDISNHQPASGYALAVLVYLDKASATIGTSVGSQVADSPAIEVPYPTIPEDCIPSALVRLDGDQSAIAESDITDVRQLASGANRADSYTKEEVRALLEDLENQFDWWISKLHE